jgi:cytosine deaminase
MLLREARVGATNEVVDVRIEDGRIRSIDPREVNKVASGPTFDLGGRVLLPAFVNPHCHLDKAFLPWTSTDDVTYEGGVLAGRMKEAKREFTVEDVRARASKALRWAIETGTTAIRTHVDVDPSVGLVGVRALLELKRELASVIEIQTVAFPQEGMVGQPETIALMEEACAMGVDVVGGKPSADEDRRAHIDIAFDLARRFDRAIDLHVDTDIDRDYGANVERFEGVDYPADLETYYLARRTLQTRHPRGVCASHLCALDALDPPLGANMVGLLRRAGLSVIACPMSNLFIQGLGDARDTRRGITRVRDLLRGGVTTAYGTDNLGDAFNLYGTTDMVLHGLVTAFACHMRTVDDLAVVAEMGTTTPAAILGLDDWAVRPGGRADLVVLDADSLHEGLTRVVPRHLVLKGGRPVVSAQLDELFAVTTPEPDRRGS